MNIITHQPSRFFWGLLLLVFVGAGCRTYGEYNTDEKTLEQIRETARLFAEDYERAKGNLNALRLFDGSEELLDEFAALVERQGALVEEHQALAEEAAAHAGNYRWLHRTYGAMVSDQHIIRDRYVQLLARMQEAALQRTVDQKEDAVLLMSRYQVAPSFYERIRHGNATPTVAQILAGPSPAADALPEDTTSTDTLGN
ncbi:MAG: hypothetical protein ACE5G0_15110 [Rhodothermales bacterium]